MTYTPVGIKQAVNESVEEGDTARELSKLIASMNCFGKVRKMV